MAPYKGFCYGCRDAESVRRLQSVNPKWYYTWGRTPNLAEPVNDFTPMIWGPSSATPERIAEIDSHYNEYQNTYLMGFNEPDLAGQADMTVQEALDLWPILERSRAKLVSPVTTGPRSTWMAEFMSKAKLKGLQIDAVALHIYQNPHVGTFLTKVDEAHDKWGKNIWITETAVADWNANETTPNRYSRTQVNDYMEGIWEGLKSRPYVTRFSWKTRASTDYQMGPSALFHTDGRLTSTGELYARLDAQ